MTTAYSTDRSAESAQLRLTNRDSQLDALVVDNVNDSAPVSSLQVSSLQIIVMPTATPLDQVGDCSECPDRGPLGVQPGAVLVAYVSCGAAQNGVASRLVMHRDAVCLRCLPAALNWVRMVDIRDVVIEIPQIITPSSSSAASQMPRVQRLQHERQILVQKLGAGDLTVAAAEVAVQRWDWAVEQLQQIDAGVQRDPFARLPIVNDEPW